MSSIPKSTLPKPYVFVLMPFDEQFNDIYKFGIKGAVEDVGAYAERLDEQIFVEGMLDRIFNQISKADVIVADMTGRNPNVFYEVGYAHALGKIVLLLTKNAEDIPFDFKHRQYTVYGGSIDVLKRELSERLRWAIAEAKRQSRGIASERISVRLIGVDIPMTNTTSDIPSLGGKIHSLSFGLPLQIRNDSYEGLSGITHVYLFTEDKAQVVPCKYVQQKDPYSYISLSTSPLTTSWQPTIAVVLESFQATTMDSPDGLVKQFRLPIKFASLPPGAVEVRNVDLMFSPGSIKSDAIYRLRLHTPSQFRDYSFRLVFEYEEQNQTDNADVTKTDSGVR